MRFAPIAILLVLIPACTSLPAPIAEEHDVARSAHLRSVEDALDRGDPAVDHLLTTFLKAWPDSVDGLRIAQNLRLINFYIIEFKSR